MPNSTLRFVLTLIWAATGCNSTLPPPTPSRTPTPATPTAALTPSSTPIPSPKASATPTSAPTAPPSATPTPTTTASRPTAWLTFTGTGGDEYAVVVWSPDSQHLLVSHLESRGEFNGPRVVDVLTREATPVRSFESYDEAVWLDPDTIVLSTWTRRRNGDEIRAVSGHRLSSSYQYSLGDAEPMALETDLAGAKSNGRGSLAIDGCHSCAWPGSQTQFWSADGSLSDRKSVV